MALTKAMAEAAGEAGWCIHLGATSNDIVDTAVGLQLRDSIDALRTRLCALMEVTIELAERERDGDAREDPRTGGGPDHVRSEGRCLA